jgi:serine/threonine-protein kinase
LLLSNRLSDAFKPELEAHLVSCTPCRNALDELAGGKPWWAEVRHYLASDSVEMGLTSDDTPPNRLHEISLGFLQSSERPESIGRLSSYEVLEVLGQGGMGIVLKALDPALNRLVAIKVLAGDNAARVAARKRFAREAQAAAAVVHDHVVPVHAVDADATPPYLVMAFISGQSLQQRIDRTGPLETKEILRIGMQTALGLAAAHAQGLVHRDVKPANIMLENGVERVRITDFGLARAMDDASVTQNGTVAGTPQYMAPEQARGEAVDQRADLFALGSVLYTMATGRAPFTGDNGLSVIRQVCDVDAPPVRSVNPDVPGWLEGIIRKLHEKNPANRFQTATEVGELLGRCLAHVQDSRLHPLPRSAEELGRKVHGPARMISRRLVVSAVIVGLVAISIGFILWRNASTNSAKNETSAAVAGIPPPEPAEIDGMEHQFISGWDELQQRKGLLSRMMQPYPSEPSERSEPARTRGRAERLWMEMTVSREIDHDPIQAALASLHRRMQVLRQQLDSSSD